MKTSPSDGRIVKLPPKFVTFYAAKVAMGLESHYQVMQAVLRGELEQATYDERPVILAQSLVQWLERNGKLPTGRD